MDARERLRRYLEQRRELGESELVLDSLGVDELMALIGAKAGTPEKRAASARRGIVGPAPVGDSSPGRATSRASDPQPAATDRPTAEEGQAAFQPAAEAPKVLPVQEPAVRFDATSGTNWRDALRHADATPPGAKKTPTARKDPSEAASAALPGWLESLGIAPGIAVSRDGAIPGFPEARAASTLADLETLIRQCARCTLHSGAKSAVPGEGDPHAELLCVGEAPGANEDETGRPFVGEAGQLLTKILAAIQLDREQVFICNVIKHRPPANRDPMPDEVSACQPFLIRQVELVAPRVILALGRFASQTLLATSLPLAKLRERIHLFHGIPVIVTYHPAALLRNEAWKRPTWADVQLAQRVLAASRATGNRQGHSGE